MTPRDVLVVDDVEDCRMLMRAMVAAQGHSVRLAASGAAALAAAREQAPDLIMLDVMMPDMSGLEVLQELRAQAATAAVPVILVTARSDDDDVMDGYQHGADYYITKPCTARQVAQGIALVLGERAAVVEDAV